LVRQAIEAGIAVVPLPGAAAAVCALVASGLSTERFAFEGFLPKSAKERDKRLSELVSEPRTLVFYEAPHRITKTLKALREALGNRRATVAREMTKLHEEFIRGSLEELIQYFSEKAPKGEMVIVLEGAKSDLAFEQREKQNQEPDLSAIELKGILEAKMEGLMMQGHSKNQALRYAARELGLSRNEAYQLLINEE